MISIVIGISGCQSPQPSLDDQLRAIIAEKGLTGDPSLGRELPDIEDPLAQLGMKLFFSKALSGDKDTACVSCHHPLLGGGDGLSLSIGVGANDPDRLGPERTHPNGPRVPRNAPTTFNIGMWDQVLFHDGRVESLGKTPGRNGDDGQGIRTPDSWYGEVDLQAGSNLAAAQSRFPIITQFEMRGFRFESQQAGRAVRSHLSARLGDFGVGRGELATNTWLEEFRLAFDSQQKAEELITESNIATAVGVYERSQVFVDTPWKAYVQGDDNALSPSAKQGALLFLRTIEEGGANCAICHRGDFFTDEQFHVLAIPQIGSGTGDGQHQDSDFGRYRVTYRTEDQYSFRTPTLLNVEVTYPYGHDGAYLTLEGIVRNH